MSLYLLGDACLRAKEGELSKEFRKSYKKECKKLKAEGWTVFCFGKAPSVEEVMMQYYLKLEAAVNSNIRAQDAIVKGSGSNVNKAYDEAKTHASLIQATQIGAIVRVITTEKISSSAESTDNIIITEVRQKITTQDPVVSLRRTLKDEGKAEVKLYYIITY